MASVTQIAVSTLKSSYPWTSIPLIVGAPMLAISGPALAVAVSKAGGLGFIGPGPKPTDLDGYLTQASSLISQSQIASSQSTLPIGVGFQTWNGDLSIASETIRKFKPSAAWLFAPRYGQVELDDWARAIRAASPSTRIWIQIASVGDAMAAADSKEKPDVIVVQGTDAGGHSRKNGAGIVTLLPEVCDTLSKRPLRSNSIPLIAAGGIIDSRGVAAALSLGAAGAAMGTRFLASKDAVINPGHQRHVLKASDGGQNTVRTQLYNHLRGTMNWPEPFNARGLINQSWRDHEAGVPFERNKELYAKATNMGRRGWGPDGRMATYAGTGVGLVNAILPAGDIVREVRDGVRDTLIIAQESISR
jgi:nitronate monooxygenase